VWDGSSQVGSEVTFSTWTAWDELEAEVEVSLESAGSGQWRTSKPVLAYEGELPSEVRSLLERDYLLLKASELFVARYEQGVGQITPQAAEKFVRSFSLVAIGDSITAGVQDGTLFHTFQRDSYANQLAVQNALPFGLPLINGPNGLGISQFRFRSPEGPFPANAAVPAGKTWRLFFSHGTFGAGFADNGRMVTEAPRNEPNAGVHNFAVTGVTIAELLIRRGSPGVFAREDNWSRAILLNQGTQIRQAWRLDPSLVLFWAGNNDALRSITQPLNGVVNDTNLTPLEAFERSYREAIRQLLRPPLSESTNIPDLVVATIPDVSVIPVLRHLGQPIGKLPFDVWLQPLGQAKYANVSDKFSDSTLSNEDPLPSEGPFHPEGTKISLFTPLIRSAFDTTNPPRLLNGKVNFRFPFTEVFDPAELHQISERTAQFNAVIRAVAKEHGIPVVDVNDFFNTIAETLPTVTTSDKLVQRGYTVWRPSPANPQNRSGLRKLDTTFGGGLFSYDGIHPTRTAQALLANQFLKVVNARIAPPAFPGLRNEFGGLTQPLQLVREDIVLLTDQRILDND
jgi:lysophospholipase L1-like esterase